MLLYTLNTLMYNIKICENLIIIVKQTLFNIKILLKNKFF